MTSKFSIDNRELLQRISSGDAVLEIDFGNLIVRELAAFRLAAMDSEPVAWQIYTPEAGVNYVETNPQSVENIRNGFGVKVEITPLYRHAQPAPERDRVRCEHAEWSQTTFGNVGPTGPLKHLSKEALEAAAEPGDLSEWADMQFLLWDAQRRAGITDEQITQAMIEKLTVNKQREWPEQKDGEPRLHIKEQPAPVVQCPFPCGWDNLNKLAIQDAELVARGLVEGELTTEAHRQAAISNNYRLLKVISSCRAAMLAAAPQLPGSEPATVPGKWIPVREQTPESKPGSYEYLVFETLNNRVNHDYWNAPDKGDDAFTPFWNYYGEHVTHWMPLPAGPQEVK